ncbi:hypothetical protein [Occallatibacter riparius]|uniref:Uncharacterized protein n=1 Tax=Occallatibacter riparius TaxID=1002689 RepID=A0A9J7BJC4_9BACT|nr:hypothetical protein [Occallatibacter riparius]UWZ82569.1 hypothetical protein MOP44_18590 [Occallatibacter riparius]
MPDQPDDPIHYDMKIPPEPQDATLNKQEEQKNSGEHTPKSSDEENSDPSPSIRP